MEAPSTQAPTPEGDSLERLEAQVQCLETQVSEMEKPVNASSMQNYEELNWLNEFTENHKGKLTEKKKHQSKKTPRDMMVREVSLLEKCGHHFIMQPVETVEDNYASCVIFERCYGSVVGRYPEGVLEESSVARQGYQLPSAVNYLHGAFLLHRGIKPEN
jgi:serine/threonine protein kinase